MQLDFTAQNTREEAAAERERENARDLLGVQLNSDQCMCVRNYSGMRKN